MSVKILLLDIETAPNLGYFWKIFKENIGLNQIVHSGYVMTWSAKWLGSREVMFDSIWESGEKKMLSRIHKLLDEADIVIHYNGKSFDVPTLYKEFVKHNFKPPSPFKQIDLYLIVRDTFRFVSNKLDYVLKTLGMQGKMRHVGFELWVRAMGAQPGQTQQQTSLARKTMERYNRRDVTQLEKLYNRLLPWIQKHPNIGMFTGRPVCTNCGGHHVVRRGFAHTKLQKYQQFKCVDCGTWMRDTKSVKIRARYAAIS